MFSDNSYFIWLRDKLGLTYLIKTVQEIQLNLSNLSLYIPSLEQRTMAKLDEILQALETNGILISDALTSQGEILSTIATEAADIKAILDKDTVTPEEMAKLKVMVSNQQASLEQLKSNNTKIQDSVVSLVPTLPSPESSGETPEEPATVPSGVDVDLPLVVTESPAEVGLEGTQAIDVQ